MKGHALCVDEGWAGKQHSTHTHRDMVRCAYMHVHTCTRIHAHAHMHTHTHTHTHDVFDISFSTCPPPLNLSLCLCLSHTHTQTHTLYIYRSICLAYGWSCKPLFPTGDGTDCPVNTSVGRCCGNPSGLHATLPLL